MTIRIEACPTHGLTTFDSYYAAVDDLKYGCLKCHWNEPCLAPECQPGAPYTADVMTPSEGDST